ncbi:stachyose synthase-like [Olea europaea subsp. europaea]|uniref:Stachyose synthase-like n=1 Tax=Olea europaea subsp. europaea TaxID=158383 RepID=A0A8S0QJ95_OLEEU|nr:stachyose synthase-like [Olea europaea subsp. europaea]
MAPTSDTINSVLTVLKPSKRDNLFELFDDKLFVRNVPLLTEVPGNVTFKSFSKICQTSEAPLSLIRRVESISYKGGFLGFKKGESSDRLINSLGKFSGKEFLSIFRFKTWWSTQWVGKSGSDFQMETQWAMISVPEIRSYAVIIPITEGKFRSALQPGLNGHAMICAESGSSKVKASSFDAIAYIHVSENPYTLMKEAYSAVRVHLNSFKLIEEKSPPPLVNKFGWCTWDAFYLTVEPAGIWHGVKEFADGGISPRFLIIDDGWQSINIDGQDPHEDAKNLVLGGTQMTARLHRFEECEKFRKYKGGSMTGPNRPPFDPKKPKMLISKAIELEMAEKARDKAAQSGVTDLSQYEIEIEKRRKELEKMFGGEEEGNPSSQGCSSCSCKSENFGMKAFTRDLKANFKGLDDIYVWHALAGAWGGVRPGATPLSAKIVPCKLSPGLDGTMTDLAVVKIIEGSIGLVHPDQADELYEMMHSYLAKVGITGVKVDVIHTLEYVCEDYGGAGWDSKEQRIKGYSHCYKPITGSVHVSDIEWDQKKEATELGEAEEYAVYLTEEEKLFTTTNNSDYIPIVIQSSTFEIFTFVPIKKLGQATKFAPIGLTNMFNCGGCIEKLSYNGTNAEIEVKGGGNFLAYSNVSPKKCYLNGSEVGFEWSENGKLGLFLPWNEETGGISNITLVF